MAAEIASAYVSLIPSFKGGSSAIAAELGGPVEKASDDAGKKGGSKFSGAFSGAMKGAAAGGAIFGGISLIKDAFSLALDTANLPAQLQTQFGLATPYAKEAADAAGKLYSQGWGESLNDVGVSVGTVARAINDLGTGDDIGNATKQAQALAQTFGQEVEPTVNAAALMVKNGLSANMSDAFDVLAAGFKDGANTADDFLDTMNEYSPQFQKLGLDGGTALGLINQGLSNGARNSDIVADALKEFSIRAVDGSKSTIAGFQGIGLNAAQMSEKIAKGGDSAKAGLQQTLEALDKVKDPATRAQLAVDLFGTQAEDMGQALYKLNPATASAREGMDAIAGSADQVAGQVSSGLTSQLESLGRTFQTSLAGALQMVVPLLTQFMSFIQPLTPILGPIAIAIGAIVVATWAWNAALAANPVGIVIVVIVALVAAIVTLWNKSAEFRDFFIGIWNVIKTVIGAVVDFFVALWTGYWAMFKAAWSAVGDFIGNVWQKIKDIIGGVVDWIKEKISIGIEAAKRTIATMKQAFQDVGDFVGRVWDGIVSGIKAAINAIIRIVNGAISGINTATGLVGIPAIPKIPMLAKGGIATGPTMAMIGEGGENEAVLPLSKLDAMLGLAAGSGGGDTYVTVRIGDKDITDMITTEIEKSNDDIARSVLQGTGLRR